MKDEISFPNSEPLRRLLAAGRALPPTRIEWPVFCKNPAPEEACPGDVWLTHPDPHEAPKEDVEARAGRWIFVLDVRDFQGRPWVKAVPVFSEVEFADSQDAVLPARYLGFEVGLAFGCALSTTVSRLKRLVTQLPAEWVEKLRDFAHRTAEAVSTTPRSLHREHAAQKQLGPSPASTDMPAARAVVRHKQLPKNALDEGPNAPGNVAAWAHLAAFCRVPFADEVDKAREMIRALKTETFPPGERVETGLPLLDRADRRISFHADLVTECAYLQAPCEEWFETVGPAVLLAPCPVSFWTAWRQSRSGGLAAAAASDADVSGTAFSATYSVDGTEAHLDLKAHAEDPRVHVSVWTAAGALSRELDGSQLVGADGSILCTLTDGAAVFTGEQCGGSFGLRTEDGRSRTLTPL